MLNFPQPPKSYSYVFLEDTDRPLPKKIDPNMRYAMFTTIAKGGKSLIKSCKDLHLSRVVCYKTLRPEFAEDEIEQRRLLREARVSAMLQHPNTVPTYELGRDKAGNYYFTMKLVHGYTLREILDYRERYDLTQLVDVIVQIGHALEYAHTHGVAHRDIKPENILVGPYGEVLLLDWGLAKVWSPDGTAVDEEIVQATDIQAEPSMTLRGALQGTVSYMSPEQIQRDPKIDARTDIYSLGAVLYEVLCGRTTSDLDTVDAIVDATLNIEPVKPSAATEFYVPSLLEDACMQCLIKDPEGRLQNIGELVRLLQEDWMRT
jgi:eukaryotic-like serine/threonine-protein kinase